MALQMTSMATSASITTRWSSSSSSLMLGSRLIMPTSSSSSAAAASPSRPFLRVTSSSDKESLDRSTKQELSPADIERNQAETTSRPSSSSPLPRPELNRRPETGDRSLFSLFAFDGAAPETINGRLAMVGIVWALVAEKVTGLSVVDQLSNPSTSGLLWFTAVVLLFTLASVIPFTNGESTDGRGWGPFNGKAERWNGRLAMLGFAALIIGEVARQAPLFHV